MTLIRRTTILTPLLRRPSCAWLAVVGLACGDSGQPVSGRYALQFAVISAQGQKDSAAAGTKGTFGALELQEGGKLQGEAKLPFLPERLGGTWYQDSTGLHLNIDGPGDSVQAVAQPKGLLVLRRSFRDPRDESWVTAMESDLRNLVRSEEAYFSDMAKHTRSLQELNFKPSTFVSAPVITIIRPGGFQATVTHSQMPGAQCAIGFLAANPIDPRAADAQPACRLPSSKPWGDAAYTFKRVE